VKVKKPRIKLATTTSAKPKGQDKEIPSTKTNSPTSNTRKVAVCNQASRRRIVQKRQRRKTTVPRANIQGDAKKGDTS
jgi:hypothetical protein